MNNINVVTTNSFRSLYCKHMKRHLKKQNQWKRFMVFGSFVHGGKKDFSPNEQLFQNSKLHAYILCPYSTKSKSTGKSARSLKH